MPGPVLISSNSGSGHPQDEALLAAALRLLERGSWGTTRALTHDSDISGRAHPYLEFFEEDCIESALSGCRLLMVVGDLRAAAARQRAALHVLQAKGAGIPVALVSVRLGNTCLASQSEQATLRILAQAESMTTCDSDSAASMAQCMNRRVTTTAPLELVLSAKPAPHIDRGIGLENEYLEELSAAERDAILFSVAAFASDHGLRATIVCANQPPSYKVPEYIECAAVPNWTQWMRALTQVRICVARPDSVALHLAVAQGAIPVTQARGGSTLLTERIGLHGFSAGMCAQSWRRLLENALQLRCEEVAARSAPLRVVAWRALGPLSDAVRCQALDLRDDERLRRVTSQVLAAHWSELLDAGEFARVEQQLETWRDLASEPGWAAARARAWTLQGQDHAGRVLLEEVLTNDPSDAACLRLLAMILWRQGDTAAAQRCWQRIINAGGEAGTAALEQWNALQMWNDAETLGNTLRPVDVEETSPARESESTLDGANPRRRALG